MKFRGIVGFWEGEVETRPGIWSSQIVERKYTGEILRNNRRFQDSSEQQNAEFNINNSISILSDLYARQRWDSIKYIIWNDVKWKVSSVEVDPDRPRIKLEIGGYYNDDADKTGVSP